MAIVRITNELRNDIIRAARHKFDPAIKAAQDSKPDDTNGDYIYDTIWGSYRERMEALPRGFFNYRNSITIRQIADVNITMFVTFSQARPVPSLPDLVDDIVRDNGSSYTLKDHPVWSVIIQDARAWQDRCNVASQRYKTFVSGVEAVLDSFTTLAPALKEWPPLWDLLSEGTKSRHKEIKERVKTDKPSMDRERLGAMTGALTAIKLGGM